MEESLVNKKDAKMNTVKNVKDATERSESLKLKFNKSKKDKPKESTEMEIDNKGKKRRREEDRNIKLEPTETVVTKSDKRIKL